MQPFQTTSSKHEESIRDNTRIQWVPTWSSFFGNCKKLCQRFESERPNQVERPSARILNLTKLKHSRRKPCKKQSNKPAKNKAFTHESRCSGDIFAPELFLPDRSCSFQYPPWVEDCSSLSCKQQSDQLSHRVCSQCRTLPNFAHHKRATVIESGGEASLAVVFRSICEKLNTPLCAAITINDIFCYLDRGRAQGVLFGRHLFHWVFFYVHYSS